ncbi:hypothetical protein VPNG_09889 [Cytospora leucostoma]|uniref:Chitin-binding type-4 domain-containing protein n=1 Tax=Cytospora leucostoma TaxID=1230097 RepID=A0A423VNN1_9PEZI|nr:hypothetical protein VPNG_09889 [Cytospora leucostoma]
MAFTKLFAAACGFAAIANGHMLMATPARVTSPAASNGPLEMDGSNFPCQKSSSDSTLSGESTSMALGSDQPLEFIGQSVHGGGSCQVSITYDENPTASSTWKVITSIEGGCPARDSAGNLGDDTSATAADPYTYNFTIPDDIPTGNAVLAWTWFNKVGNREMYMNCALVELTGTSGSQSSYDALPDMFTANIGNGCATVNDKDVTFPDPGEVVQKLNGATDAFAAPSGSCQAAATSVASAAATTTAAGSSPTTTAAATSETSAAGGIFASITVSIAVSAPTTTAAAAAATSASSSTNSASSESSSSGSESAGSACSTEGEDVCAGSDSYLVCASGIWTSMPVAAGTACSGSGANFEIVVATSKKFMKTRALRWVQRNLPLLR